MRPRVSYPLVAQRPGVGKEKPPQGERGGFLVPGRAGGLNWPASPKLGSGFVARKGLCGTVLPRHRCVCANLAGVTRLPYGGALTSDALKQ